MLGHFGQFQRASGIDDDAFRIIDFDAGQWISVPFGPKVVRAWTILSSPTRRRTITLSVDVAPGGMGSQWLCC